MLLAAVILAAPVAAQNPTPAAASAPHVVSFAEARDLALKQASAYTAAEDEVRVAELGVREAKTGFLPHLDAPLSYIYTSPLHGPEQAGIPYSERPPSFIANNGVNEYYLVATASGAIDINGKLRAELDRTRADLARARAAALVAKRGLVSAVSDAYYGLALARAARDVANQSVASATDFLDTAQLLFEGGEVPELDTLKARVDLNVRRDEQIQAALGEQDALDTLNSLLGLELGTPTVIADLATSLPDPGDTAGLTIDRVLERPEFAELDAEERAASAEARSARADRLPSLGYSVSAGVDDSHIQPSRDLGAAASVTLTVPLFDWGAARGRQTAAEIRRDTVRHNREIATRALRLEYSKARAATDAAANRIRIAGSSVVDASRALEISELRYRSGEAPVLEVVDARTTLAAQRTAFFTAIFDYHVALDRLRQAAGQ